MKSNKYIIVAVLNYISAVCFYIVAISNFKYTDGGMGVVYLCLGSVFLCLGGFWLTRNKKK